MANFNSYPAPSFPLSGSEQLVLAQATGNPQAPYSTNTVTVAQLMGGAAGYAYAQPTSGGTVVALAATATLLLDPAGALAALTVDLPSATQDGQTFQVSTTQTITALTASPASGSGQTVSGGALTLTANGGVAWLYRAANTTWYRTR